MPGTITTNDTRGLGYQTGYFSGTLGSALNQGWFDSALAGRVNDNKVYKEAYNCNLVMQCTLSTWMDTYMGYETYCYPKYTLLESNSRYGQIKADGGVTIPAYPGTGIINLDDNSQFVGGTYVLPQVGNTIVIPTTGQLAKITAVTHATGFDTTITVQLRSTTATSQVIADNDLIIVLSGSTIEDCACPTGQFRFDDMPIEQDLEMITIGDKGTICGDALNKCQFLKIPFTDECGNTIEKWYTDALSNMYKDFETRKHFERLLNPNWGIIPTIKARGIKFVPTLTTAITTDDIRDWKAQLDINGIMCREYAVFAGRVIFSQFQRMLLTAGVTQLDNSIQPLNDCKWINMEYCGIRVEGLTLHIYEECTFSSGKLLGSQNYVYPNSAILVPMCNRSTNCRGAYDEKMLTTVYFKSNDGRVWDNLTDSNGILGPRNTFGTGCETQEWTVKSRFLQEVHCANAWGYIGL